MEDCERKYKEAFNMAVLEHKSDNEAVRESIERIFPQLKESEDERIRKALISAINNICNSDEGLVTFNGFSKGQVLAWLEKQGKHANFRNKIQIGDKVTRNQDGVLVNLSQLKRVAVKGDKGNNGGISPNSEWSEEDEYNSAFIQEALLGLDGDDSYREKCCKMADWLESLKEKFVDFDKGFNVGFSAAKHNQWKPSEEQMDALAWALSLAKNCGEECAFDLRTLQEQLKKLREE